MNLYIKKEKTAIQIKNELKLERINRIYSKEKVDVILGLEKSWREYALLRLEEGEDAFRILYHHTIIRRSLKVHLNEYENRWKRKLLSREDFESVFLEKLWKVSAEHSWYDDYYLYEKLTNAMKCEAKNLIKAHLRTDKRKANHVNVSLIGDMDELDKPYVMEEEVVWKILIEQYCNVKEQAIIIAYLSDPNLSFRDLGEMQGISHPQKVKRILRQSLEKLKNETG
jgi:hypothetical protein